MGMIGAHQAHWKAEALLRFASAALAAAAALVISLDTQTKTFLFVRKKATVHALHPLWGSTQLVAGAAGYQLLQLVRCVAAAARRSGAAADDGSSGVGGGAKELLQHHHHPGSLLVLWACLLLDQGVAYLMFAAATGAAGASMIAVTGVEAMQWTKLCDIYGRFCAQVGGGILCGLASSVAMAAVACISARRLFGLRRRAVMLN